MPDPYDPETEKNYNWFFNLRSGEWIASPKENNRRSFNSFVETRATPNGIEVRKAGTKRWTPASQIISPKLK